ncbi:MAG: hypothetical protein NZM26_03180 [Patescibacteria group bacterium]|nr:hypothetical protein [Patescibacteria group bacterium]
MEETQLEQTKQKTETINPENAINKLLEEAPNITKAVDWYHYGKKKGQKRRFELNEESQNAIATLSEKLANASFTELLEAYQEIKEVSYELNNSETTHVLQKKAVLRSIRGVVETRLRYKVLDSLEDKPEEKAKLFEEIEELKAKRKSGDKRASTMNAYIRYAEKLAKSEKKEKINTDLAKRIKKHLGRYALIILTVLEVETIPPRAPNSSINQPQTAKARIEFQKQAGENMPELFKDNLMDLLTQQNNQPQNEPSDIQIEPKAQQVIQESAINENDTRNTNLRHAPDSSINEDEYSEEQEKEVEAEKNEKVKLDEFDLKQTGRISKEKIIEILKAYNADYEDKESLASFFLDMEKKYGIGAEYI